jgi:hypothetical protein
MSSIESTKSILRLHELDAAALHLKRPANLLSSSAHDRVCAGQSSNPAHDITASGLLSSSQARLLQKTSIVKREPKLIHNCRHKLNRTIWPRSGPLKGENAQASTHDADWSKQQVTSIVSGRSGHPGDLGYLCRIAHLV